jgi:pimeloyl-ACP methyl ester carboxylesterase
LVITITNQASLLRAIARATVLTALLLAPTLGAAAAPRPIALPDYAAHPGQLVDVGGYKLNLYCFGAGEPTILMLSGGAWGAVAWAELQPQLAGITRVCAYDRAGMNFSEIGPVQRAADQDLRDLQSLVVNAKIKTPLVLVGWSAGGMLARWYANGNPGKVAAIVTVDGSDFDYWDSEDESAWLPRALELFRKCQRLADSGAFERDRSAYEECSGYGNPLTQFPSLRQQLEPSLHDPAHYSQWLHDLEHESDVATMLRASRRSYGAMPLRVILAGDHFRASREPGALRPTAADIAFIQHAYQILALSSDSEMLVVPDTSHAIHFDRPDFVAGVIADVVAQLRGAVSCRACKPAAAAPAQPK